MILRHPAISQQKVADSRLWANIRELQPVLEQEERVHAAEAAAEILYAARDAEAAAEAARLPQAAADA